MGIGCWSYGGGDYWGDQAQSDVDAIANMALDAGIIFFDTAVGYNEGWSEQSLGIALKHRRQEALIGTKTGDPNPATLLDQLVGTRDTAELAQNLEAANYAIPADLVKQLDRLT